jgi:GAF domain-containing protein
VARFVCPLELVPWPACPSGEPRTARSGRGPAEQPAERFGGGALRACRAVGRDGPGYAVGVHYGRRQALLLWEDLSCQPGNGGSAGAAEETLCQHVIDCGVKLVIGGTRRDLPVNGGCPVGPASVMAWAGFPVRGPDGRVVGALCVADHLPRQWSSRDVEVLRSLADVAAGVQMRQQHLGLQPQLVTRIGRDRHTATSNPRPRTTVLFLYRFTAAATSSRRSPPQPRTRSTTPTGRYSTPRT